MRRRRRPEGGFDRTQLNTNPTRARTTMASAEMNEWGVGDGGGRRRVLTDDNYFAGQWPEL